MYLFLKNTQDKLKVNYKGDDCMIKQIAWNTFKNTGNINTYLELTEMKKLEDDIILGEKYGNNQNQRNNNSRK